MPAARGRRLDAVAAQGMTNAVKLTALHGMSSAWRASIAARFCSGPDPTYGVLPYFTQPHFVACDHESLQHA